MNATASLLRKHRRSICTSVTLASLIVLSACSGGDEASPDTDPTVTSTLPSFDESITKGVADGLLECTEADTRIAAPTMIITEFSDISQLDESCETVIRDLTPCGPVLDDVLEAADTNPDVSFKPAMTDGCNIYYGGTERILRITYEVDIAGDSGT